MSSRSSDRRSSSFMLMMNARPRLGSDLLPPPDAASTSDEEEYNDDDALPPPVMGDDLDDEPPPMDDIEEDEDDDGMSAPPSSESGEDRFDDDDDDDDDDATLLPPPVADFDEEDLAPPSKWAAGSSLRAKIALAGKLGAMQRRTSRLLQARATRERKHSFVSDQFRLRRELAAAVATQEAATQEAPSDWEELVDERSQRVYYRSVAKGQQLWHWPATAYSTNVWYAELRSLVAVSSVETLQTAMRGWADADKAVCVLRELPSSEARASVMSALNATLLRLVFKHAGIDVESKIGCCRYLLLAASEEGGDADDGGGGDDDDDDDDAVSHVKALIASCSAPVMVELLGTVYEEEELLDDVAVGALLETVVETTVAEVLESFGPDEAHSIARHWSEAFAADVLAAAKGPDAAAWRDELRALLDEGSDESDEEDEE